MTFSLLVHDHESGTYGGAAATGSLCVGGWVLRGGLDSGLSASQGTAPSTFWGEDVLRAMRDGSSAREAVASITSADPGRGHRQLSALDLSGRTAGFTGDASVPYANHIAEPGLVVAGNMLGGDGVLPALRRGYLEAVGSMAERLVAALRAADADASDKRGLKSAALLVLHPERPPLTLRIDYAEAPLDALEALLGRATSSPYADWLEVVPVAVDRSRAPKTAPKV
ncbi:DUF1028 domain-containing protein [Salipiger bermudensis]|uniref:DUF1028 domain-containing protein n=1 Tax=Salipiger bermudensis TaxID=344736 RepID=UPI001C99DF82|nr:DUF1028 domain-containing protein [Salipiger bermudensis]MBY6003697.1 DUF1028 domain-containing protein [Salipiger bermudensis]